MRNFSLLIIFALANALAGFTLQQSGSKDKKKNSEKNYPRVAAVSFSKDVFPIIKKHCLPCHASDSDNRSELVLESYDDIITGGKHGTPVVPGKGSESLIVQKVSPNPPFGKQMPLMTKKKLNDGQIDTLRMWIDQGAKKN
ncbi:MAG: hypothetical protein KGJ59_10100 [Bacteroidota bacterium]|nr:hypothetical protein [Bacteroidota bacterium]